MSTLVPFGGPVVVREIAVGAGDDADWTLASAIPAGAQFTHPGGPLHLTFETIDANGDPVAPATADFDYEVRQVVGASVFGGVVVANAVPNQRYVEGQSPDGGYAVRVINKANMPAGSTLLRIKAQAGDGTSELAIRTGTIAQLQALTSTQVSVGDVAWSRTHRRMVYVLTASASASVWAYNEFASFDFFANIAVDTERFVPLSGSTDRATASGPDVRIVAAADGYVHSVSTESSVDTMGVTTCRAYADATGDPTTLIGTAPTQDIDTADKGYVFTFPDGTDFVSGDRVAISLDPTGVNADCGGTVTLGYIITAE